MTAPARPPSVKLNVNISAELTCTNGVQVAISQKYVTLSQPEPRGGEGPTIVIPLRDWDAVVDGVEAVRRAITEASDLLEKKP